ncbi:MAG: arginine--tRNA ligase [Desulfurococcaceae archaeon]
MSEIANCILDVLPEVLSKVLNVNKESVKLLIESGKLRITSTPDPKLGDYGISLHVLLKTIEKDKWEDIGSVLSEELYTVTRDKCWVEKVNFINGYVNFTVNYFNMLEKLVDSFIKGNLREELTSIGKGTKVIVEHTSANPIHPLHIGSGRNSVLGDTYARLLRKLGFDVETRFYVNDLGRQVAILAYGVKVLESKNISRPKDFKPDHWYGVIYALTHIIIELSRLREEVKHELSKFLDLCANLCMNILSEERAESIPREMMFAICEITWKRNLKIEALRYARFLYTKLKQMKNMGSNDVFGLLLKTLENLKNKVKEYSEYVKAERRLALYYPDIYNALRSGIKDHKEAEVEISKLMSLAEKEDPNTVSLFRRISEDVLEGFKQTLQNINIYFDGFDFESSNEILNEAHNVVNELLKTNYVKIVEGGAVEVDLNAASKDHDYIKNLFHPDQAGRFIIRRSDGTTLYITRDIAYTLYKFRKLKAERVYNVIAIEQAREQKQLKAVLYMLGYSKEAENLHHFAYEMVHLKGMRMSGRRGIYYTLDEMLVDNKLLILQKLMEKERTPDVTKLANIAEKIAVANTRGVLLSVDPGKVLVFDPRKISEMEYGVIVEYAFVRAQGIIRNLWNLEFLDDQSEVLSEALELTKKIYKTDLSIEEKKLVESLARFKNILIESYNEMKPNKILEYAVSLSLDFNKFYEKHPIISERDESKKSLRILITILTLIALSELMDIMGFPKLRKM